MAKIFKIYYVLFEYVSISNLNILLARVEV